MCVNRRIQTPGLSWSQWRNLKLLTITRSSASPLVGTDVICIYSNEISTILKSRYWISQTSWTANINQLTSKQFWQHQIASNWINLSSYLDLKTMTERLKNRYYVTKKLFIADLQRVITNCREYNPPDSEYCKCANTLEKFFYFKLKEAGLIEK